MTTILGSYGDAPTVEPIVSYDAGEGCDIWVYSKAWHFAVTLYDRDADLLLSNVRMFDTLEPAVLYAIDVATKSQALIQGSR
jgi:hypothetical protein